MEQKDKPTFALYDIRKGHAHIPADFPEGLVSTLDHTLASHFGLSRDVKPSDIKPSYIVFFRGSYPESFSPTHFILVETDSIRVFSKDTKPNGWTWGHFVEVVTNTRWVPLAHQEAPVHQKIINELRKIPFTHADT